MFWVRISRDQRGSTSVGLEAILGACLLLALAICIPAFMTSAQRTSSTFKDQVSTLSGKAGGAGGEPSTSWDMGVVEGVARTGK